MGRLPTGNPPGRPSNASRGAGFVPLCMDDDELALWLTDRDKVPEGQRAPRPCTDCPVAYAADMRRLGKCNGTPGDYQEAPMLPADTGTPIARRNLQLPCAGCIHIDVCAIRQSARDAGIAVDVETPTDLHPALSLDVTVDVSCSHYQRAKGYKGPAIADGGPKRRRRRNPETGELMPLDG